MPYERCVPPRGDRTLDRKSTRLNSSHTVISYAVFCLKKKTSASRSQQLRSRRRTTDDRRRIEYVVHSVIRRIQALPLSSVRPPSCEYGRCWAKREPLC